MDETVTGTLQEGPSSRILSLVLCPFNGERGLSVYTSFWTAKLENYKQNARSIDSRVRYRT